jgi:hypothetical protein
VGGLFQRLNRYQALVAENSQLADAEQKARWEKGNRDATVAVLRRQISSAELARMVENDELDPNRSVTLSNELASPAKASDDPRVKFAVETNLLAFEEDDIAGLGSLSHDTRAELILKRREEAETWKADQGAQEAVRRIDVALGIPAGLGPQYSISVTPDQAKAAANARSYFYDLIEALPEAERKTRYFEMADKAVKETGKDVKRAALATEQRSLQSYLKQVGRPEDMNDTERAEYDATVKRRRDRMQQLEKDLAQ